MKICHKKGGFFRRIFEKVLLKLEKPNFRKWLSSTFNGPYIVNSFVAWIYLCFIVFSRYDAEYKKENIQSVAIILPKNQNDKYLSYEYLICHLFVINLSFICQIFNLSFKSQWYLSSFYRRVILLLSQHCLFHSTNQSQYWSSISLGSEDLSAWHHLLWFALMMSYFMLCRSLNSSR